MDQPARAVRVLPDTSGPDKEFDYLLPAATTAQIGSPVRIDLGGRRVGGWVVATDVDVEHTASLKPVALVAGIGPDVEVLELCAWAAHRWSGRRSQFLVTATPSRRVAAVTSPMYSGMQPSPESPATARLLAGGGGVLQLPPCSDPLPAVWSALGLGPVLVVVPGVDDAALLAARIRRAGPTVALWPDEFAAAAGGVDVVVGTRSAAFARVGSLGAIVLIDEHDERLQSEAAPTWHARDLLAHRAHRRGIPFIATSPVPTPEALTGRAVEIPSEQRRRRGWSDIVIVERGGAEPWARSLLSSELIAELRDVTRRVIAIVNVSGRSALMACAACSELARCERCGHAVRSVARSTLVCRACAMERPLVCTACGSGRFRNLRPGVDRIAEEFAAAAGREVVVATAASDLEHLPATGADVVVGTEAALHRVRAADTVAIIDADAELLAPRFRAGAQFLALVATAARRAGPADAGGRVMIQTSLVEHPVIRALANYDPTVASDADIALRRTLGLPPFGALAVVSGVGASGFADGIDRAHAQVVSDADRYLVRAADADELAAGLATAERPAGQRLRVAVDPARGS